VTDSSDPPASVKTVCDELLNLIRCQGCRAAYVGLSPSEEHCWPDVEQVIRGTDRYWVVEKLGHAGEVAECNDLRSDESFPAEI
jgi:hypothetical protein